MHDTRPRLSSQAFFVPLAPPHKVRPAPSWTGRGRGSMDNVAGPIDDLMKPLGVRRVLGDPPVEGEGDGIE